MGLKQTIRLLVGEDNFDRLIQVKKLLDWYKTKINNTAGEIRFVDDRKYKLYALENHNFFGYYDLEQYSADGKKILAHVVKEKANPETDSARLVYFDTQTGQMTEISTMNAWCWQQGARLRWHPVEHDTVLFNDIDNGRYVMKKAT